MLPAHGIRDALLALVLGTVAACTRATPPSNAAGPGAATEPPTTVAAAPDATMAGPAATTDSAGHSPSAPPTVPGSPAAPAGAATTVGPLKGPGVSASIAMAEDGTIDPPQLVAEINRQRGELQACGALVRKTDQGVGSLNLEIELSPRGQVRPDLQSPVNAEARQCILRAAGAWNIRGAGVGRAMVLLVLDDAAGP